MLLLSPLFTYWKVQCDSRVFVWHGGLDLLNRDLTLGQNHWLRVFQNLITLFSLVMIHKIFFARRIFFIFFCSIWGNYFLILFLFLWYVYIYIYIIYIFEACLSNTSPPILTGPPTRFWGCQGQNISECLGEWHKSEFPEKISLPKYDFSGEEHDPPDPPFVGGFVWKTY